MLLDQGQVHSIAVRTIAVFKIAVHIIAMLQCAKKLQNA
jgi:hypothetical protein